MIKVIIITSFNGNKKLERHPFFVFRYNGTSMPDHGIGWRYHGGPGLHHGEDQGEAGAREAVPGGGGRKDAPG